MEIRYNIYDIIICNGLPPNINSISMYFPFMDVCGGVMEIEWEYHEKNGDEVAMWQTHYWDDPQWVKTHTPSSRKSPLPQFQLEIHRETATPHLARNRDPGCDPWACKAEASRFPSSNWDNPGIGEFPSYCQPIPISFQFL